MTEHRLELSEDKVVCRCNQILIATINNCACKVRLKFLSTEGDDANENNNDDATGAMTIVLRIFM